MSDPKGRKLEPFVSAQTAAGVSANPSASSGAIEADARTASPAQTPAGRSRAAGCRVSSCDSMQKLARRWHLHRTTMAAHLRRAGVAARHRGTRSRNWAKPNGSTVKSGHVSGWPNASTVKSGHVSGWPSATDVMTRLCGSAKSNTKCRCGNRGNESQHLLGQPFPECDDLLHPWRLSINTLGSGSQGRPHCVSPGQVASMAKPVRTARQARPLTSQLVRRPFL
jgi:hypothetical protein